MVDSQGKNVDSSGNSNRAWVAGEFKSLLPSRDHVVRGTPVFFMQKIPCKCIYILDTKKKNSLISNHLINNKSKVLRHTLLEAIQTKLEQPAQSVN